MEQTSSSVGEADVELTVGELGGRPSLELRVDADAGLMQTSIEDSGGRRGGTSVGESGQGESRGRSEGRREESARAPVDNLEEAQKTYEVIRKLLIHRRLSNLRPLLLLLSRNRRSRRGGGGDSVGERGSERVGRHADERPTTLLEALWRRSEQGERDEESKEGNADRSK
jgi:hypothetical protein